MFLVLVTKQKDVHHLGKHVNDFGTLTMAKVNWKKNEALAVGRWSGEFPNLPGGLVWKKGGIKFLDIYLRDEITVNKNWEDVTEKVLAKLNKWKWLLPKMSFRRRTLVINNLVASTLWHCLVCMEPSSGLIKKLQAMLVDSFWDKLHWVPQAVVLLVHIESRVATFCVQFIQKYLTAGCKYLVWKDVASTIPRRVNGLGIDVALFLIDVNFINLSELSPFYKGVLKHGILLGILDFIKKSKVWIPLFNSGVTMMSSVQRRVRSFWSIWCRFQVKMPGAFFFLFSAIRLN